MFQHVEREHDIEPLVRPGRRGQVLVAQAVEHLAERHAVAEVLAALEARITRLQPAIELSLIHI